jgi:hypothetical protein
MNIETMLEAMQYEEYTDDGDLIEPGDLVIGLRDGEPYTYTQPDLRWKPAGPITAPEGILVFPLPQVQPVPGIYLFLVAKGPEITEGYVGQTGDQDGFVGRFDFYVYRGKHPAKRRIRRDGTLGPEGATSKHARQLLDAIAIAGQTVSVYVMDDPALADNTLRRAFKKHLIGQLCRTGVVVWHKMHVIDVPLCDGNGGRPEENGNLPPGGDDNE